MTGVHPIRFIQTAVALQDFNVETLETIYLKANELLHTSHSFTSREFALFAFTKTVKPPVTGTLSGEHLHLADIFLSSTECNGLNI